eukprot:CAMPEP_0185193928 /NCGR_PEP_ID=MMETSP1140-20130426/28372_1 /TAXON_ID=298111 /ORGANISM="Pavlova sp., Strain CCMP459" /LENGTH=63 /DNA_ID=CAMNT_0027760805 /DNA_START=74 /DNA_END=265 /DNA_ORIENTATION=+
MTSAASFDVLLALMMLRARAQSLSAKSSSALVQCPRRLSAHVRTALIHPRPPACCAPRRHPPG